LDADKRTLLVFGGSRGSRAINNAILQNIESLLAIPDLQILHVSGKLDAEAVRQDYEKLPDDIQSRYHLYDYLHDIGLAFASADLVISRAGAATLAEFPFFGLPAILIPLAYSWRYQEVNADWLANHGAAIRLDETRMTQELVPLIQDLFTHTERLQAMREAAQALVKTDGAANIARIVINLSRA
jgi:UDP-N-acetylglucosamine--N-acetylmuramyl-(pentapeptide) pyrophosphoryl-undecaprenol N-acetylglucosamine transferase